MEEIVQELGHYKFYQIKPSHQLTSVTVLLCDFAAPIETNEKVIDLGTGSAVIPMLLTLKTNASDITGVEVSKTLFNVAEKNIKENSLGNKIKLINSDWRDIYSKYNKGSFDKVLSNPPYIKKGTGNLSPNIDRAGARAEVFGDMNDLLDISIYLAGTSGRVYFVYPLDRLEQLKSLIKVHDLTIGRFKLVYTKEESFNSKSPSFFLIEFGVGCTYVEEEPIVLDGGRLY